MLLRNVDVEKLRFSSILYGAYRLPVFYMAIYITVCAVLAAGDKPPALRYTKERMLTSSFALSRKLIFPEFPISKRNPQFTHSPKSSSSPNFAVEPCEA